jgi:murein DD-endopeptidase MepM/ murein hydrolase activator NlpD
MPFFKKIKGIKPFDISARSEMNPPAGGFISLSRLIIKNKLLKIGFLLIVFVFSFIFLTKANLLVQAQEETIDELNRKIESQQKKIEELKRKAASFAEVIKQKQSEAVTLANELAILDNRIAQTQIDIEVTNKEINKVKDKIKAKELEINLKEKEIEKLKIQIAEFIRLIYRNDQRSYLEILFLNNSFSEFFNEINFSKEIQGSLQQTLDELQDLKYKLEQDKTELIRNKKDLEDLKTKLNQEKTQLDEQKQVKELLLSETKSSERRFVDLLGQAKLEQQAVNAEIVSLEKKVREKLEEQKRKDLYQKLGGQVNLSWPISSSRGISAIFHDPDYPFRYLFEHPGVDIRAPQRTQVRAATDGYVGSVRKPLIGKYSYVMIIHNDGISTVYGHLSSIIVEEDQFVAKGQVIGLSGATPGTPGAGRFTTGPHLHFEVRLNGIPVDPLSYLP